MLKKVKIYGKIIITKGCERFLKKIINKNIIIEYYKINSLKKNVDNNTYQELEIDITPFLEKMKEMNVKDRKIQYNGEFIFLQTIDKNINTGIWELIFYKTTNGCIPDILDKNGDIKKYIELDDDESLSQPVCMLYDSKKMVAVMQRNVFAVNTRGIETFIESYMKAYSIKFRIFSNEVKKEKILLNKERVKKIKIAVHIQKNKKEKPTYSYIKKTKISEIFTNALETQCGIINIELSMGNTKDVINLQNEDFELFEELLNNKDIKKMEIGTINDYDSTMQITDFIDVRIKDIITIQIDKGKTIDKKEVLKQMYEKYIKNKSVK